MINVEHYKFSFRGNVLYLNNENYVFKYLKNNSDKFDVMTFLQYKSLVAKIIGYNVEKEEVDTIIKKLPLKVFIINADKTLSLEFQKYVYFILKDIDVSKGMLTVETPDGKVFYSNNYESIFLEEDFIEFQNDLLEKYLSVISNDNYRLNIEKDVLKEVFSSKSFIVSEK